MSGLRTSVRAVAADPRLGPLASGTLSRLGATHVARRVSLHHGAQIPEIAEGELPRRVFSARMLRMATAGGRDQVAARLWTHGWTSFEAPLPLIFSAAIRPGDVVLDVGANTGYYSLLAASTHTDVTVHAFEPLASVRGMLVGNLELNSRGTQVTVHGEAIDETAGTAQLYVPLDEHGLVETSASLESGFRSDHSEVINVTKTTIDDFVRALPTPKVDLIKIDVEGLEDRVLAGAADTMKQHRPVLFVEVLDCEDWRADCPKLDALRNAADYVNVRLRPDGAYVAQHVAADPAALNQALWPRERLPELWALCHRVRFDLSTDPAAPIPA